MNRHQFLTSVAGLGVSVALPAKPDQWIKGVRGVATFDLANKPDIIESLRVMQELSQRAANAILYGNSHPEIYQFTGLAALPLDSRREPWQACDAGDVPVQE